MNFLRRYPSSSHILLSHIIDQNPYGTVNNILEYKRRMKRHARESQLEEHGSDQWNLPRIWGEDDKGSSVMPMPPCPTKATGYIAHVSQIKTKLRHNNPHW